MNTNISKGTIDQLSVRVFIGNDQELENLSSLNPSQKKHVKESINDCEFYYFNQIDSHIFLIKTINSKPHWRQCDNLRKAGFAVEEIISNINAKTIGVKLLNDEFAFAYSFVEGLLLSTYKFQKYKSKKTVYVLDYVIIEAESYNEDIIADLRNVVSSVFLSRDLVNEPIIALNVEKLAAITLTEGSEAGLSVQIKDKDWIEKEGMGGILAVNKGSIDPPKFIILENKPIDAINSNPVVLVGKGIVYDTGGLSLKSPANMETMKADMGGAAAVIGAMISCAKNKIPLWIKGYVPATDNRPGENAYAPGDVIKMHNGMFVEVLNTDAEGRMVLADALSYASKDNPELVIDIATLTGAAQAAVGDNAVVTMGTAGDDEFAELEKAGFNTCERVVRFPFWDEYGELIKSDIADIKNVGGPVAGAITAGKFLEHFTAYKWMHIDISGSAFLKKSGNYRGLGATGFGVRLLYDFLKNRTLK